MYNFGPINQITNNKLNKNKVDKNSFNNKVSELENKNNIQDNRIDLMIQNPGTATEGNNELLDIRVGYDGAEYNTAGNAVREQINTNAIKIDKNKDIIENEFFLENPKNTYYYSRFNIEKEYPDFSLTPLIFFYYWYQDNIDSNNNSIRGNKINFLDIICGKPGIVYVVKTSDDIINLTNINSTSPPDLENNYTFIQKYQAIKRFNRIFFEDTVLNDDEFIGVYDPDLIRVFRSGNNHDSESFKSNFMYWSISSNIWARSRNISFLYENIGYTENVYEDFINRPEYYIKNKIPGIKTYNELAVRYVFLSKRYNDQIRGKEINFIDLPSARECEVQIIKTSQNMESLIKNNSSEDVQYDIIATFNLKRGWNRLTFNNFFILGDNEWLGLYIKTNAASNGRYHVYYIGNINFDRQESRFYPLSYQIDFIFKNTNTIWVESNFNMSFPINIGYIGTVSFEIKNPEEENQQENSYLQKLKNKKVSFLGDSISTYQGYVPSEYAVFYPKGDINSVEKTWWYQVCENTGMVLLKNASWSGSTCHGNASSITNAVAGCSDARINDLSDGENNPDIVIILIGINDLGPTDTPIGNWTSNSAIPENSTNISTFSEAYALMVSKILTKYPDCRVFCCTLLQTGKGTKDEITTGIYPTTNSSRVTLEDYNKVIRDVANGLGCDIINTTNCGIHFWNFEKYTVDNPTPDYLHPNAAGATMLANKVIAELLAKY